MKTASPVRAICAWFCTLIALTASAFVSIFFSISASASTATFTPLGDLPGGAFYSWASAVSDDGSTVVGQSRSSSTSGSVEAFRWTLATGMEGLGDFDHVVPKSTARDVSADGSVVVGMASAPEPRVTACLSYGHPEAE